MLLLFPFDTLVFLVESEIGDSELTEIGNVLSLEVVYEFLSK